MSKLLLGIVKTVVRNTTCLSYVIFVSVLVVFEAETAFSVLLLIYFTE